MRRVMDRTWGLGVVLACVASGVTLAMVAVAQEAPPTPPKQETPPQGTPPQGAPAPVKPPVRTNRPAAANKPVTDVQQYRGGVSGAVTRAGAHFALDLSKVDLAADPLLVIDGKPVTQADLARQMAFSFGANEIEQFLTGVLLRRVKAELTAAGKPLPDTGITEEDVKAKFEEDKKVVPAMRGMTTEQYEKAILEGIGWARYVEFQKLQMEFERFFLPDPPKEWAKKQRELADALDAEDKAKQEAQKPAEGAAKEGEKPAALPPRAPPADLSFVPEKTWELMDPRTADTLRLNYARGHALHPLMRTGLIGTFRKKLLAAVDVRVGTADEPDVALHAGDATLSMADLLSLVGVRVEESARRIALREIANLRAVDARLAREGALLSEAEAEKRLREWREKYERSLITADQIVSAYGYNSGWHYREVHRRKQSYRDLVLRDLDDDKLVNHYDRAGRLFFEGGTMIGQVLYVPSTDLQAGRARIDALLAEVAAGTRTFAAIAREEGKFPDSQEVRGGAIQPLARNKLRAALQESEYANFLTGHSFADEAFYAATEGSVIGPVWRDSTPEIAGWYAVHVDRFFTTGSRPGLDDPKLRDRAIDDLVDVTFPRYVNEALAAISIELPAR